MAVNYQDDTDTGLVEDEVEQTDETTTGLSDLKLLRKEIVEKAAPPVRVPHPADPRWVLVCHTELPWSRFDGYRKVCTKNGKVDLAKVNALVIGGLCTAIERDGRVVADSEGRPITFASKEFHAEFEVANRADAVRVFLRSDGFVGQVASLLMQKCGYGEDIEALDGEEVPEVVPTGRV